MDGIIITYIACGAIVYGISSYLAERKAETTKDSVGIGCVAAIIWPVLPLILIGIIIGKFIFKLYK